jgi:hypothetical protein
MKEERRIITFIMAVLFSIFCFWSSVCYILGQEITKKRIYKDAFENGLMQKEVDKDDNVIYRWIELHKL